MFDKQAVEEYRLITAPDCLKDRVIRAANTQKRTPARVFRMVGTLAACLAVIVAAAVLWSPSPTPAIVSTDGSLLTCATLPTPAATTARMQAEHCAAITLRADGKITVDSNAVFCIQHEDGSFESISFPYTASDTLTLYWYVTSPDATMTVNGIDYILHADEENGLVTIVQD